MSVLSFRCVYPYVGSMWAHQTGSVKKEGVYCCCTWYHIYCSFGGKRFERLLYNMQCVQALFVRVADAPRYFRWDFIFPSFPSPRPLPRLSPCVCHSVCFGLFRGVRACVSPPQDGNIHVVLEYMDRGSLSDVIHSWRGNDYGEDLMAAITFQVSLRTTYRLRIYVLRVPCTCFLCLQDDEDEDEDKHTAKRGWRK